MGVVDELLVNHGHVSFPDRNPVETASVKGNGPFLRFLQSGDGPEQGGLAGQGPAQHGVELSPFELQTDPVQMRHAVDPDIHVFQ